MLLECKHWVFSSEYSGHCCFDSKPCSYYGEGAKCRHGLFEKTKKNDELRFVLLNTYCLKLELDYNNEKNEDKKNKIKKELEEITEIRNNFLKQMKKSNKNN